MPKKNSGILKRLKDTYPERNVAFTAVSTLKKREDIKQFFLEYVKYLKKNVKDPLGVARSNIGYIVGYYDTKTASRWFRAIKGISHPIYGRRIPFFNKSGK